MVCLYSPGTCGRSLGKAFATCRTLRHPGRPRGRARTAEPLGEDQPFFAGRHDSHVLYAEPDKTSAGVANFLSDPRRPIVTTLHAMMTTDHLGDRPHPDRGLRCARTSEQERERAIWRALHCHVFSRALSRSRRRESDEPVPTGASPISSMTPVRQHSILSYRPPTSARRSRCSV